MRRILSLAAVVLLVASGCTLIPGVSPSPDTSPGASGTDVNTQPSGSPATPTPITTPASAAPTTAATEPPPTTEPTTAPASAQPTSRPSTKPAAFKPSKVKLRLEPVVDVGSAFPVYLTGDGTGQGRLYLVQRAGLIRIMNKQGKFQGTLLDLRGRVGTDGERGLHAVAFHPRFKRNGKFYVHYNTPAGNTRVVEYRQRRRGQEVSAGSGRTLLDFTQPEWNHNGGWLGFGPDGYLYIALGDGGGNSPGDPFGNGQDKSDLFGSILRIDVDKGSPYSIPRDNPFAKGQGGARKELWNFGLRNPWRASFDRKTGDLWIGDVGQDLVEEIDVQREGKGGLNFGWSTMEGSRCHKRANCSTRGLTLPVSEYPHGVKGCSVVGGYVYRGDESPLLQGAYLFTDYCSKSIFAIDASKAKPGGELAPKRLLRKADSVFVSMGEDDEGELYVVSFGGGVYHLVGRPK